MVLPSRRSLEAEQVSVCIPLSISSFHLMYRKNFLLLTLPAKRKKTNFAFDFVKKYIQNPIAMRWDFCMRITYRECVCCNVLYANMDLFCDYIASDTDKTPNSLFQDIAQRPYLHTSLSAYFSDCLQVPYLHCERSPLPQNHSP